MTWFYHQNELINLNKVKKITKEKTNWQYTIVLYYENSSSIILEFNTETLRDDMFKKLKNKLFSNEDLSKKNNEEKSDIPSFLTVKLAAKYYPSFTENSLRHYIFMKDENGLSNCIKRAGKKILIDREKFEDWIKNGNNI